MIIKRYIGKELLKSTISITLVLCFVFLCNRLVRLLGRAAAGKLSAAVLGKIVLLQIPYLLGLLLPIGFYLAIMLVFTRMIIEHEVTILNACGLSRLHLFQMIFPVSVIVMTVVACMVLGLNPALLALETKLVQESPTQLLVDTLMPGRFHIANDGKQVYYVETIERETDTAKRIFMATRHKASGEKGSSAPSWIMLSAATANQVHHKNGATYILTKDGIRYAGQAGQANFQWVHFATLSSFLTSAGYQPSLHLVQASMSNTELWRSRHDDPYAMAELQWRFAIPLSVPLLGFLAFNFCRIRPRQGRYEVFIPAILGYIIFANLMFISRSWLQAQRISPEIGLWWVLALTGIAACCLSFNWRVLKGWL